MRPFRPLLAVLVLTACGGDPAPSPDAAPDAVTVDTAPAPDVVDAVAPADAPREAAVDAPDVVAVDVGSDAAEVAQADVVDAPPADAPADTSGDGARDGGVDVPDVSPDVPSDVAADAPDVPSDVPVCVEGWRQCNGRVLEVCQGNRWVMEPECAALGEHLAVGCYANTCFTVCHTEGCIANGGGVGHEGVCRTDADCVLNVVSWSDPVRGMISRGNGRCEGGLCATQYARTLCPSADAGTSCYDLLPTLGHAAYPENRGCISAGRGICGGASDECTSEFQCPRGYTCAADPVSSLRTCLPR